MRTILIPIDFTIASLYTLREAMEKHELGEVNVVLMYAERLNDSISDLLFNSSYKKVLSYTSREFEEALSILKNRFESNIQSLRIDLFSGNNANSFKNFVGGNRIDMIYIPKGYDLKMKRNAFNPIPFIRNSRLPFHEIVWTPPAFTNQLDSLFK